MDSDGQHTVKDALKLFDYVFNNPRELVIGKRIRSGEIPLRSRIGNSLTKTIYHITTGVNIYDTQTGLRAFTDSLIDFALNIEGNRYEYEMNVLLYAPKLGIKITEIEIETIYIDNNSGSHFNPLRDSYRIYKEILKFSLASIVSFITDYVLYILFVNLLNNVIISNILARVISASLNYTINKYIVFKSNNNNSLLKYTVLAISILILNTFFLKLMINLGVNILLSKVLVEMILFIMSWLIQKKKIFRSVKEI